MKIMEVITAGTLRELVNQINSQKIEKDWIVSILKEPGQFILLYYRRVENVGE